MRAVVTIAFILGVVGMSVIGLAVGELCSTQDWKFPAVTALVLGMMIPGFVRLVEYSVRELIRRKEEPEIPEDPVMAYGLYLFSKED